jgi:ABC-2 type transport system permease protein
VKAFMNHLAFEFGAGVRNKNLLLMNYLFPLGFYFLMGFIKPAINPPFRETLIPAMVVFAVLSAAMLGIPDPLVNARENGIFRSYKINGVPALSILVIPVITTTLHLLIIAFIITVSAPLLFAFAFPVNLSGFILAFTAMTIANCGIAVLIGVVSSSSRMTVLWSQLIFVPSMLLGGVMIPYSMLPGAAGKLSQILPATHAMNAFKGLAMGFQADFSAWGSIIILLLTGVFGFVLALFLFSWDTRNTRRRGPAWLAFLVLLPSIVGTFFLV